MVGNTGSYTAYCGKSMESKPLPVIVNIGLNDKTLQILASYLGKKYYFVAFNSNFSMQRLSKYKEVALFVVNTDCFWLNVPTILRTLDDHVDYQNVPVIGLALKRHFPKLPQDQRILYEDIVPMPCSNEDLLSRIDIWVRTYEIVKQGSVQASMVKSDEFTSYGEVQSSNLLNSNNEE